MAERGKAGDRVVQKRRNPVTGLEILWLREPKGGYSLVCIAHHQSTFCPTFREAEVWMSQVREWCPGCKVL